METETCIRCGREFDIDSDEFTAGEATEEGGFICEGCLTQGEQQAIYEDTVLTALEADEERS